MSVVYKERERERERDGGGRSYTTVRRYRVPDRDDPDNASVVKERELVIRKDNPPATREVKEYRVEREVEREEREVEQPRRELEYRVVEREREREVERAPVSKEIRYERDLVRVPSPSSDHVREYREVREIDRPHLRDSYDLERYTRSVDYYAPQPIIIRQEPIIIRERDPGVMGRDRSRYELIERDEVRDDRALVRHYYYERRTREVDRGPKRDGGGGEHFDEREHRHRRDIDPRDSASQHADDYSSEDDTYIRREKIIERDRSASPHHRRHLAEGAIAGIGAAEIIRHHRKQKGEEPGHRGRNLVGSAALGAVGAEVLSRARSKARSHRGSHSRSRSRSSSSSDGAAAYRRSRHRKHRSRSRSKSRIRQLGGVAAVAAVGALAGYALRNRNKQQIIERRSRSRHRRGSVEREEIIETGGPRSVDDPKPPDHRNRRIAQAGLASAAAAGLWQRIRSRSRGAKGKSRSRSRLRAGVPIAAAGLGGAAVAGLYERSKARKEAQREQVTERGVSVSPSRSRSRSRSVPYGEDPNLRHATSDPALIEYGGDPIYAEQPGEYRRRHRGGSSDSSPDRRRRRSRSRSNSRSRTRGLAEAAAAAGIAGAAAHELTKRSERKKAEKERRREYMPCGPVLGAHKTNDPQGREREDELYAQEHPYTPPPMGANAGEYAHQGDYYPQSNSFPPPPANDYSAREANYPPGEYPPYNPADYPPPPGGGPNAGVDHYPPSPGAHYNNAGGYGPNETFVGDNRHEEPQHQSANGRRGPDNPSHS
ncbi:hypothetical protein ANO11243_000200 [Dothideomycetidae sp. 11243]|nr:hypothetical protein ANO11243_000200 [fungal sp. No.11243]